MIFQLFVNVYWNCDGMAIKRKHIYYNRGIADWRAEEHVYRITTILQALTVNGSTVQNDPN